MSAIQPIVPSVGTDAEFAAQPLPVPRASKPGTDPNRLLTLASEAGLGLIVVLVGLTIGQWTVALGIAYQPMLPVGMAIVIAGLAFGTAGACGGALAATGMLLYVLTHVSSYPAILSRPYMAGWMFAGVIVGISAGVLRDRLRRAAGPGVIRSEPAARSLSGPEARFRSVVEAAYDGIYSRRGERVEYCNPAFRKLVGAASVNDIVGQSILRFIHRDDRVAVSERMRRIDRGELPRQPAVRARLVRLDGEERLIEAIAFAVPGGGSIQVHVIARDITKQAAAERRLAEQGAQLRLLFDRSTAGIVSWSPEGRILAANQAFGRFTGYTIAELTGGMHMRDLRKTDEDDGEEAFRRLADGRIDDITLDRSFRHRDGRTVWGRMSAARISAASEEAGPAFMGVLCDVTETHDALDRLQTLNDELERRVDERTAELRASLRELDSFSHAVTHDLRAPLRSVSGYSEFVLQDYGGALPDDARQMLRRVVDSGRDMSRMIEALFNLSRLGRAELRRTKVDLSALARVVSREIRDAEPNRTITFTIAEDLQVEADPMLMRSVLQNLLGNAAKYTRDVAEPQVEFGRVAGNTREFFVRDNGAGFDMSQAKLLFAPFRRLHSAGEFEGTGIGLATVKKIIERHGGRVRASAVPRGGATFFFRL